MRDYCLSRRPTNHPIGSTLGSAREFKEAIRFIERHQIVPVIDMVIHVIDHAHEGFPRLADSEKRSGGKVVVQISTASSKTRM